MNSPNRRWLYLPVEIRVREFDARLLVGCCAVERGYNVIIGMKNNVTSVYPYMPRGIIFDRSLSLFRENDFKNLVSMGFRICATDEETLTFYITPESTLKQRVSAKNLELADCYFAWGQHQADLIDQAYPGFKNKVKAIGSCRSDLNRPEFLESLYHDDVHKLKGRFGRFIFLPANFSEIENKIGGRQFLIEQFIDQGAISTQEDINFFNDFLDHKEKNLKAYKKTIPLIQKAFPEHTLIIRPHPGEAHQHWIDFAKLNPRLVVLHEGPVTPWLIAADVVFHHGCSTGLEAYMLGTPSIPFHPYLDLVHDVHLSTRIGPIAETVEDFLNLIRRAVSGEELPRDNIDWLYDYIVAPKDGLVSDQIIDAFDEVVIPPDRMSVFARFPHLILFKYSLMKNRFRNKIKRLLGLKVEPSRQTKRWGYMDENDVLDIISKLTRATGRFAGTKVKKLDGQVFCLYRD